MHGPTGDFSVLELFGVLQWNEFEGGFWSLVLDAAHAEFGPVVVMPGFEPPAGARDGSRLRVRARAREEQIGFQMAGPIIEPLDAELVAP